MSCLNLADELLKSIQLEQSMFMCLYFAAFITDSLFIFAQVFAVYNPTRRMLMLGFLQLKILIRPSMCTLLTFEILSIFLLLLQMC